MNNYPEIREALAIKAEQDALEVRFKANQEKLKHLLMRNSRKSCLRIVMDKKIITVSASNAGRVVQTHVSDLDGIASEYDVK